MVAALLGACVGFGLVVIVVALVGVDIGELRPRIGGAKKVSGAIEGGTRRLILALVLGVVVGLVTRWPVAAILGGLAGFFLPSITGGKHAREHKIALIEGVASWAEMLRDTMAGAGGLEQSIIASAGVAPEAIRPQVTRLASRLERDRLAPALRDFADEIDDPAGDLVVAALVLAADKSPKRLGDLLGRLAVSAREEVNMRLRVDAGRARTRTSVRVTTGATAVFALGMLVLNRDYLEPYNTFVGQVVLAMVGACFGVAYWWMAKAATSDEQTRFLTRDLDSVRA
jgi:tight adherence protein B